MGKKMTLLPIELPLLLKKHDHKEQWFLYRHIQYISMSLYSKESSQTCTSGAYKHIYNYTQEDDKDCVLPSPAVIPSILLSHSQLTTGSPLFCFRTTNPQIPRLGCLSKTSVCWTFLRDLQLNCYVASIPMLPLKKNGQCLPFEQTALSLGWPRNSPMVTAQSTDTHARDPSSIVALLDLGQ